MRATVRFRRGSGLTDGWLVLNVMLPPGYLQTLIFCGWRCVAEHARERLVIQDGA